MAFFFLSLTISFVGIVCQKLHAVLWDVLKRIVRVKDIEDTKMMHHQTRQLVKCLCKETMGLDYAEATSIFRMSVLSAARLGIHEIVEEILESFPSAIRFQDGQACNIIQLAVMYRRENVFNLLYQMTERRKLIAQTIDINANTLLHLAAKLAPVDQLNRVSGAAMQMQRELQWYKEVEKFIRPDYIEMQNLDGKTPQALFTEEHKFLVEVGEKWMKDTADSCTVASTLIATIAFAAAITVPGGNNDDNGIPNFAKEAAFICFAISNALSLFSSTASLLMFLSIRTARYEEADFLYALPHRLSMGFITLFLSITSMMMTFSATLYLMFGHAKTWILIPVAGFSLLPVSLFVALQFPFLLQMIKPTYGRGVFGKKSDRLLY